MPPAANVEIDSFGCNSIDVCVLGCAGVGSGGDVIEEVSVIWIDDDDDGDRDTDVSVSDCGRETLNIHFCGTLLSSLCGRPSWKLPFEPRA